MSVCEWGRGCTERAVYLITYEDFDSGYELCARCTAEARANDPLEYIESVRSLPPEPTEEEAA